MGGRGGWEGRGVRFWAGRGSVRFVVGAFFVWAPSSGNYVFVVGSVRCWSGLFRVCFRSAVVVLLGPCRAGGGGQPNLFLLGGESQRVFRLGVPTIQVGGGEGG